VAIRPILQLGNPVLREKSAPVKDAASREVAELVGDLKDTLVHWRSKTGYGRGIAAPQLGAAASHLHPASGSGTMADD
jgi:peptide deformylase